MVRRPNAGSVPLPTVRFEVTERGFLPEALGIQPTVLGIGGIRNQTPGFFIAHRPNHMNGGLDPTGFLEDLAPGAVVLTGRVDQMFEATFLTGDADFGLRLHAD